MSKKLLSIAIVAAFVVGVLFRLYPLAAGEDAIAQFFITEDGYLMLTIARNMAIGLGMTVSEGTIVTNGVQPMATFVFTIPYLLTDGDKLQSLVGIILISTVISVAAYFTLQRFAQIILGPFTDDRIWSWFVATLWFIGPVLLHHSMNALETGLYTLMVLLTLLQFGRVLEKGVDSTTADRLVLGAICGLTFLARIDGAFLVVAVFLVWGLYELFALRLKFLSVIKRLVPPGLLSLVFAAPWLTYNKLVFGSITPISGHSQSHGAEFADNLHLLPSHVFEYLFPMLPVPNSLETVQISIFAFTLIGVAILAIFMTCVLKTSGKARRLVVTYLLFAVFIAGYYSLYFGAAHFLSRYLAPLAPLFILATVVTGLKLSDWSKGRISLPTLQALGAAAVVLSLALLGRLLVPGVKDQGHFQVVDWVQENVPEDIWVGAVQTGTLGYWRDRTINLDGKVNPSALRALQTEGNVLNYVLGTDIQYVADWSSITDWVEAEYNRDRPFASVFEIVVKDDPANLGVLKRRTDPSS